MKFTAVKQSLVVDLARVPTTCTLGVDLSVLLPEDLSRCVVFSHTKEG